MQAPISPISAPAIVKTANDPAASLIQYSEFDPRISIYPTNRFSTQNTVIILVDGGGPIGFGAKDETRKTSTPGVVAGAVVSKMSRKANNDAVNELRQARRN